MVNLAYPGSRQLCKHIANLPGVTEYLFLLRRHSEEAFYHSGRVAELCIDLIMPFEGEQQNQILMGKSGLLHDLGKKDTPAEILEKPGRLTEEEMIVMMQHVRKGYIALEGSENQDVRTIIAAHHNFQEKSYPRRGEDRRVHPRSRDRRDHNETIYFFSQVLAVCDMYDALANKRAYKEPMPPSKIEEILREQFTGDPCLINYVMARA